MRVLKLFCWSLKLDLQFLFLIPHLSFREKVRFIFLKYYFFLKCSLSSENLHHARVFGLDYFFPDRFGLASLQRVYCSSYRLKKYLPSNPLILDVGANIGQFNFFCRQYLDARRVISIEPIPLCLNILKKNSKNSQDCMDYAITSESQSITLFLDLVSSQLSSCLKDESKNKYSEITVQGIRLDELVEGLGLEGIDLLKVDTEGSEYDVLLGGKNTLDMTKTILVEMSIFRKSSGNLFSSGHLIQEQGFTLVELLSLSGTHPEDADGLFIRR